MIPAIFKGAWAASPAPATMGALMFLWPKPPLVEIGAELGLAVLLIALAVGARVWPR